jgi:putative ABC transport system permease protein
MFRNYLQIALRTLTRQKVLAFINVSGLSIGIACFCLFLVYAVHEFSFDRFHKKADRIFRVAQTSKSDAGDSRGMAEVAMPVGPTMKKDFPDVEFFARVNSYGSYLVRADHSVFQEPVTFADPQIFSIFSFPLAYGRSTDPIKDPHSVVLSKAEAVRLFGKEDVVGRTLEIKVDSDYAPFRVSGITEDIPTNSSIRFSILGSFGYLLTLPERKMAMDGWNWQFGDQTFVLLRSASRLDRQPERLEAFYKRYLPEPMAKKAKQGEPSAPVWHQSFYLQPLREIHTSPEISAGPQPATDPKNIWILIGISSSILLIACINFTTLAIGRSAGRAKEVGIRKVIGGRRTQLTWQFLTESMVLSIASMGIGLLLAKLLLPLFNQLSGTALEFSFSQFPELLWMLAGLTVLVGLVAGIYPAIILSGFQPVDVLKSKVRLGGSNFFTRSLVTLQFLLSAGLIICTLVIFRQLNFLRTRNLGLDKEHVIVIHAGLSDPQKIYPLYRHEVESHPEVMGIAASSFSIGEGMGEMNDSYWYRKNQFFPIVYPVDPPYLKVLGMQLVAGRNFDPQMPTDSAQSVIINESLAKEYISPEPADAIGREMVQGRPDSGSHKIIIGVVKDFNFEPLTRKVRPQLFRAVGGEKFVQANNFFVRIRPGDPGHALEFLRKTWEALEPAVPFRYSFMDEDMDHFYDSEKRWSQIVGWAGGISIFLACLGLFGMVALAVVNRTQEIGIRKVLGASAISIVLLLVRVFLRLILVALVLAMPLTWYFMNQWLQRYAYRISLGWEIFAIAGVASVSIALITIGLQSMRAALSNPAKSLRVV